MIAAIYARKSTERIIKRDDKRAAAMEQLAQVAPEQAKAVMDGTKR